MEVEERLSVFLDEEVSLESDGVEVSLEGRAMRWEEELGLPDVSPLLFTV